MKKHRLQLFFLLIILILGFSLRIFALDKNPAGFFCDEAAIGYNAYTILTTGRDEYGTPFPTFFRSFGEFKSPIAIYATVPVVLLLGLNELSVRLQSVLFGMVTIVMVYLITKELFTKKIALTSAAIAATMPWLIHYNRTGFEMNSYLAFFTATIWLLIKAVKQKEYIIPAFFIASLSLYTYYSAKLVIPLFLLGFLFIYGKKILSHKKELSISALVFIVMSIPFILSFLNGEGTARFNEISVFSAKLPFSDTLFRILTNYASQLSPALFLHGEQTFITRHFTNGLTPFLAITIPFFYIGIGYVIHIWKKPQGKILLLWLLLYPIGAAVVAEGPFTGRTIVGAPLGAILIALGITVVIKFMKTSLPQYASGGIIGILIMINTLIFINFYFLKYPHYSADFWGWQYGSKEIVSYFENQKNNYDELYLIGEFNAPYIFFKFYAPNDCEKCLVAAPHEVFNPLKRQFFAVTPHYLLEHPDIHFNTKKIIYYPNDKPAFFVGEVLP